MNRKWIQKRLRKIQYFIDKGIYKRSIKDINFAIGELQQIANTFQEEENKNEDTLIPRAV